jgi:hypothetical protein
MGKKFDKVFESVLQRYQIGGYLPGDCIKFREGYKSTATYNAMNSRMKQEVDALASSGLVIRVTQIGDKLGGQSAWNQHKTADSIVLTIAGDQGGGRSYATVTVSPDMVDCVDMDDINYPNVPDQFKKKDVVIIKPEPYNMDSKFITNVTDKGNGKNTPTQLKLGESVKASKDNTELADLYESVLVKDYSLIYEKVLITDGLLRRMATKIAGGFKSNPMQREGQIHEFSQSAANEIAHDVSKSFGGDKTIHTRELYKYIKEYLSNLP